LWFGPTLVWLSKQWRSSPLFMQNSGEGTDAREEEERGRLS